MIQNVLNSNASLVQGRSLAGAAATLVLMSLAPQDAAAQGWQITTFGTSGSRTMMIQRVRPGHGGVIVLKDGPAPPNNCRVAAFEIVNPRGGEARCVGVVSRR